MCGSCLFGFMPLRAVSVISVAEFSLGQSSGLCGRETKLCGMKQARE
jgi:hypothetical protein